MANEKDILMCYKNILSSFLSNSGTNLSNFQSFPACRPSAKKPANVLMSNLIFFQWPTRRMFYVTIMLTMTKRHLEQTRQVILSSRCLLKKQLEAAPLVFELIKRLNAPNVLEVGQILDFKVNHVRIVKELAWNQKKLDTLLHEKHVPTVTAKVFSLNSSV